MVSLLSKVTYPITSPLHLSQIVFHAGNNRTICPSNMVTSPLRSLLLIHMGDFNSEVPLYILDMSSLVQYDT